AASRWWGGASTAPSRRPRTSSTCTTSWGGWPGTCCPSPTGSTTTCATSPTTITPTRVRRGASSDTGTAADRALIGGGTPRSSAGLTPHELLLSVAHAGSTDQGGERIAPLR